MMAFRDKRRNRWIVRWRSDSGRQPQKSFKTLREAAAFESELKTKRAAYDVCSELTFRELAAKFVEAHVHVYVNVASRKDYESALNIHILPHLGHTPLRSLMLRDLIFLQAKLAKTPSKNSSAGAILSPATVNFLTSLVKQIVRWGISNQFLAEDHLANFRKLKISKRIPNFWTIEERDEFLEKIRDPKVRIARNYKDHLASIDLMTTALYTGMRKGELFGLKRDSIDLGRRTIVVRRSFDINEGRLSERTKSGKDREIPMHDVVYEICRRRKNLKGEEYVFDIDFPRWITKFKSLCQRLEMKPIRFHDLRHTFGAILASRGVPLPVIQKLLGHSKIEVTMIYAHLLPGLMASSLSALDLTHPDRLNLLDIGS